MSKLVTARRVVDMPEFYGGGYDLITGRRTAQPPISKSPTAFACMNIRGQELANLPWHIMRKDEILEKHPLIDMLTDFGPESNYQRGIANTEIDLLSYGAGIWVRDADILKRLNPDTVKVIKTADGIQRFEQTLYTEKGGQKVNKFDRKEVVYFREYHPEDDLGYGIPVVEVCKRSINAEIEALLMIEALYKNDAVPGLFLSSEQDVTEKEADRVIAWWNKRFRGGRNKGKVGIAGKGLKPTPVGSTMKDSMVMELLNAVQNDICVAMRVPMILVRSMSEATYVNLSESRKFLIEDVIIPRAVEYQNVINQDLCNVVDPSVRFEFAWDELQILQEDATAKWMRLQGAISAGVISDEFARQEMGWEESAAPEEKEDPAVQVEKAWERKALKALDRGESPDVEFETDTISIDRQYLLHGRLGNAKTAEAVRACFK